MCKSSVTLSAAMSIATHDLILVLSKVCNYGPISGSLLYETHGLELGHN